MNLRTEVPINAGLRTTLRDVRNIAEPLLASGAFQRLGSVTFLGILSPRFAPHPPATPSDGTREQHSLGVACVALDCVRHLCLPIGVQRYAAAWALLHDVATWPLSHTSEPAFSSITGVDSRTLRRMIILGHRRLPAHLRVTAELRSMGVAPEELLQLFERTKPDDPTMRCLWQILRSPITPDTLEGIHRAGHAYGVPVPPPESVWSALRRTWWDVTVDSQMWPKIAAFWHAKARVYAEHLNTPQAILTESHWARAIEVAFRRTGLATSLSLTEEEVLRRTSQIELPHIASPRRYKPPLEYFVAPLPVAARREDLTLDSLNALLAKRKLTATAELHEAPLGTSHRA